LKADNFFKLAGYDHAELFDGTEYVWEALANLGAYLDRLLRGRNTVCKARIEGPVSITGPVYIGDNTSIEPGAHITGPAYICNGCEIRHNAYIRGNVLIGNACVVENSSELKNAIFLDDAAAPHFAYVGDSILGRHVNLGAGTRLSNLPIVSEKDESTKKRPTIRIPYNGVNRYSFDEAWGNSRRWRTDWMQQCTKPRKACWTGYLDLSNVSLPKGVYPPHSIVKLRQQLETVQKKRR
jgi:NDP-sugar pyrophosphorylase family protein